MQRGSRQSRPRHARRQPGRLRSRWRRLHPRSRPIEAAAPIVTPSGERTLTVSSTGYTIRGRTSTGIPTAPGVVAVDPSVIPLGTRLTIPGYGVGIAADTGSAVQGNTIDVWFPTKALALQWGRRVVTVTIH